MRSINLFPIFINPHFSFCKFIEKIFCRNYAFWGKRAFLFDNSFFYHLRHDAYRHASVNVCVIFFPTIQRANNTFHFYLFFLSLYPFGTFILFKTCVKKSIGLILTPLKSIGSLLAIPSSIKVFILSKECFGNPAKHSTFFSPLFL